MNRVNGDDQGEPGLETMSMSPDQLDGDERAGPSSSTLVRSCAPSSAGPRLIAAHCSTVSRLTCTLMSARTRRFFEGECTRRVSHAQRNYR